MVADRRRPDGGATTRRSFAELTTALPDQGLRAARAGDLPLERGQLLEHRALTRLDLREQAERSRDGGCPRRGRLPLDEGERAAGLEPALVDVRE